MQSPAHRYLLLDAMRGIAAFAVLWGHLTDSWRRPDLASQQYILAVDFFFILSGFVIGHAYGARMKGKMSGVEFAILRVIRLHPLLVLAASIGTAVLMWRYLGKPGFTVANILGTGALAAVGLPSLLIASIPRAFPANGPAWSLFFELFANFIYAAIARHLTRNRLIVIVILAAAALIATAVSHGSIEMGWQKGMLVAGSTRVLFGFFAGLLIYELRPGIGAPSWLGYVLLAGVAFCLLDPAPPTVQLQLAMVLVAFPLLVWLGSAVRETPFVAAVGKLFGALSYPIYILHWPFVDLTRNLFLKFDPTSSLAPLWAILQIGLILLIAWLAMKLYDAPVRAWLMRQYRALKPPAATAGSHAPSA